MMSRLGLGVDTPDKFLLSELGHQADGLALSLQHFPGKGETAWQMMVGAAHPASITTSHAPKQSPKRLNSPRLDVGSPRVREPPECWTANIQLRSAAGLLGIIGF